MKFTETLETSVEIAGVYYKIDMSFDNILLFLDVVETPLLTEEERICYGLYTLLGKDIDLEMDERRKVLESLIYHFISDGDKREVKVDLEGNVMPMEKRQPAYDFNLDASYIYSSFKQAYGIDLYEEKGKLDWRKFKILLRDLPEDTIFKKIIDVRTRPYPKGKGMAHERRKLKEAKRLYALPRQ